MNSAPRPFIPRNFVLSHHASIALHFSSIVAAILTLALALLAVLTSSARPQQDSTGARGLFLDSRPIDNKTTSTKPAAKSGKMGLGYTLFLEQSGASKRVNPDHVFHSGDRVRILVETNRDVYLYVFHQEGPGAADLLFPDSRLRGGENIVEAHKPSFVPHTGWFTFDNQAGDEKLTLVASEKPLEGVPRKSDLKSSQAFHLDADKLQHLVDGSLPAFQDAVADEGKPMTATEGTRGLTLSMNDPPPSRLIINKTTQSGWISAQVTLTHR